MPTTPRPPIREIFNRAIELSGPERQAFLESACAGDAPLRSKIDGLIASAEQNHAFLSSPTANPDVAVAADAAVTADFGAGSQDVMAATLCESPGTKIGPYKLLQLIGEGGFGSVFMAEQEKPVARRVALKIIKLGMDTRQVVARFEQERQALALMDHPNIARVLDAGATETGRPFFVMELVKGDPIVEYCDKNNLSIEDRLELFAQVCNAVQHAHTKGIIHRDIKPSNILVSTLDGRPSTKVIDFGIAKATASKLTEKTLFTEHRQLIGTPEYMSPEQAEGNLDIDTRTDVYSLGVLLYELLTGTTPFSGNDLRSAAYAEIQRIIREIEPPKPSTRISANTDTISGVAARRSIEPKKLGAVVRGELDWIVMRALEKDRQRRYETANGLAMDIRRYLAGEAVVAAPPSTSYRFKKFVRRNKGTVTAGAIVSLALVLGMAGTAWQARRAADQRDIAIEAQSRESRQHEEAERQRAEAVKQKGLADENAAKEVKARKRAEAMITFVTKSLQSGDPMATGKREATIAEAMQNAVKELDAGAFADDPEIQAGLHHTVATVFKNNSRYAEAEAHYQRALAINENNLDPDNPEISTSLNNLALILVEQGKYAEAEPLYKRSLAIGETTFGKDHPELAQCQDNLAELFRMEAKYADALSLYQQALATRERVLGPYHPDVAQTLNNLALLYQAQLKYAEAEPLILRAIAIFEKAHGRDHPLLAQSIGNLALLYQAEGRLEAAEPLFTRVLAIYEKSLGPDHLNVASSLNNLALLYQAQGRFAEAEPLFKRSLIILENILGTDHPTVAANLNNQALLYQAQGRLAEAEPLYKRALAIREETMGMSHPTVASSLNNLASLYLTQGKFALAEPLAREGVETSVRASGKDHSATGNVRLKLGRALAGLNRFAEAEAELIESEQVLSTAQGVPPGRHKQCIDELVKMYLSWDKAEEGKGHDAKAAEWKGKLDAMTPPAPPKPDVK